MFLTHGRLTRRSIFPFSRAQVRDCHNSKPVGCGLVFPKRFAGHLIVWNHINFLSTVTAALTCTVPSVQNLHFKNPTLVKVHDLLLPASLQRHHLQKTPYRGKSYTVMTFSTLYLPV